jgi:hypothetical protein
MLETGPAIENLSDAVGHRMPQDSPNRVIKRFLSFGIESTNNSQWAQAGLECNFVSVNVADSTQKVLVQQQRFQCRPWASSQPIPQYRQSERFVQGLRTQTGRR